MARRRLTPAQPVAAAPLAAPETKSMPLGAPPAAAPPIARVSGQSAEAAALRDLAHAVEEARRGGRMLVDVPLGEIVQGHLLRDRVTLDREELDALKASIRAHGQRVPAELVPLEGAEAAAALPCRFGLISGWRRLRALGELAEETGDERFGVLRALIRPAGEAVDSYVAMVEENEIRAPLSYYERARLVAEVTRSGVFPDRSAALRTLFATASRAKRSKIASFIDIHEELGDLLGFPAEIPERLGLALVAALRGGAAARMREELAAARPASAADEMALLEQMSRAAVPAETAPVSRAKQADARKFGPEKLGPDLEMAAERKGGRIRVTLSGGAADDALLERVMEHLRGMDLPG